MRGQGCEAPGGCSTWVIVERAEGDSGVVRPETRSRPEVSRHPHDQRIGLDDRAEHAAHDRFGGRAGTDLAQGAPAGPVGWASRLATTPSIPAAQWSTIRSWAAARSVVIGISATRSGAEDAAWSNTSGAHTLVANDRPSLFDTWLASKAGFAEPSRAHCWGC